MTATIHAQTQAFFSDLGDIKSRSMFGGFGIFCDGVMFALVINDALHLRATEKNESKFKELGLEPYRYSKRGFPIVTKYFAVPQTWWTQTETLMDYAKQSLKSATKDQIEKKNAAPSRIKDLPNLRLTTERLLKKAGIDTVEKLYKQGSLAAFRALQSTHSRSISLDLLWAIEGAISGKHWSVIPSQRRDELLTALNR